MFGNLRHLRRHVVFFPLLAVTASFCGAAEPETGRGNLRTAALVSDNMVIQQGMRAPLWGWADPGETVTVRLSTNSASAVADAEGRWEVTLGPLEAEGPCELEVASASGAKRTIANVMVGEVWIASGQSNMEMPVGPDLPGYMGVDHYKEEIAAANHPQIRIFRVEKQLGGQPLQDVAGQWIVCSPDTIAALSAVGYFFAREISTDLKVPVGIVWAPWGGMPAHSFISREGLQKDAELKKMLVGADRSIADYRNKLRAYMEEVRQWELEADKADAAGLTMRATASPQLPADPRRQPTTPTRVYNGMIAPLIPYAIKGAIWYQGETNAMQPSSYEKVFAALITDWREHWQQGDFPFLFVQLANYNSQDLVLRDSWAIIREAQRKTLAVANTGMAVAADIGMAWPIHPTNKQDVGKRLALVAKKIAYGKDVVYSGPLYESMQIVGDKIRLSFEHVAGGLAAKNSDGSLVTGPAAEETELKTFTIAGADKQFVPAEARIDGCTVVVWSDQVKAPVAVRYAWSNNPEGLNLYNQAALPASPFRTDDFDFERVETVQLKK